MSVAFPGPSLPPTGRSLFDFVVTAEADDPRTFKVPFPFEALVQRIEEVAGSSGRVRKVLIPIGRSLQRNAANPEFFKYPRAVVGVTPAIREVERDEPHPEGRRILMLQDRLFLGYQERAAIIEVISYNEAAGRFEFQVVNDYRAGGSPEVRYAPRGECLPCHQNQAPIFSRPLWGETNANPSVASRLAAERDSFYGIPARQGVDAPEALDVATDRANMLSVYQFAWTHGCGGEAPAAAACRAAALITALRYRLAGSRHLRARPDEHQRAFDNALAGSFAQHWPAGVAVPNPDLLNRTPDLSPAPAPESNLLGLPEDLLPDQPISDEQMQELIKPPRDLEPFNHRLPLAIWGAAGVDPVIGKRIVEGLAGIFDADDIRRHVAHLRATGAAPRRTERRRYSCRMQPQGTVPGASVLLSFALECGDVATDGVRISGTLRLRPDLLAAGTLAVHLVDRDRLSNLQVLAAPIVTQRGVSMVALELRERSARLRPRFADGSALVRAELSWTAADWDAGGSFGATVEVTLINDFAVLVEAIEILAARSTTEIVDALANRPFRRVVVLGTLFRALGMSEPAWCCIDSGSMPPPRLDERGDGRSSR